MPAAAFYRFLVAPLFALALAQSGQSGSAVRMRQKSNPAIDDLSSAFARRDFAATVQKGQRFLQAAGPHLAPEALIRVSRLVGAAQLAAGDYVDALRTLTPALRMARERSDNASLVSITNNIAWVYVKMENLAAASEYGDEAVARLRILKKTDARVFAMRALVYAKERNFAKSDRLFSESVNDALDAGNVMLAANSWYLRGRGYAVAGRYAEAQDALTESFRLRKLHHLPDLEVSMRDLAEVLAARGDLKTSSVLLDEAVAAMGDPKSTADTWGFLLDRGRLRMMKGDLVHALPDLRDALALARRLDVIPTDDDRVTFESGLADLYSLFIDCGNRLYLRTRNPQLKAEIFEAAEENRAASLRALVPQPNGWRTRLPVEHGDVLARLQNAERELLSNPGRAAELNVRQLRVSLDQIESRAQAANSRSTGLTALETARRALDPQTAILSFHLGPAASWLWLITQKTFEVYPLPAEPVIAGESAQFRAAVRTGAPARALGDALGDRLFGSLPAEAHAKRKWVVALDQELFDLPLAAVMRHGRYLIEDHAILMTPGVRLLSAAGSEPELRGPLVAVGDPIYNRADPRWTGTRTAAQWNLFASASRDPWHFSRLIGSGEEARAVVKEWGNGSVVTGKDAVKKNFLRLSQEQPTIIHLATHVIRAAGDERAGLIVLGLNPRGEPEFLDMREIVKHSLHAGLVVMSGCASGDAKARAASGLMGLTRAWLGSGVGDVLATRWPSLDDNGPFFFSFYSHLRDHPETGAAGALQEASIEMIRSCTFRANPDYWASYFLIGRT